MILPEDNINLYGLFDRFVGEGYSEILHLLLRHLLTLNIFFWIHCVMSDIKKIGILKEILHLKKNKQERF